MTTECDVAIVGAGPVGMALAVDLGRSGVRVVVLEARSVIDHRPKAGLMHARTLQVLARRGIGPAPDVDLTGTNRQAYHFAGIDGVLELRSPRSEGPALAYWPQNVVERQLEEALRHSGVPLLRGVVVTDIDDLAGPASARLTVRPADADSGVAPSEICARWVVGCDGARSTVRRLAGITSTEHPATCRADVAIATIDRPADQIPQGWHRTETGFLAISPEPTGGHRIMAFRFDDVSVADRAAPTPASMQHALDVVAPGAIPLGSVDSLNHFSDFARRADHYRRGAAIVIGDAAHVHFPLGAQGLNLGMIDAAGLGWRLAGEVGGSVSVDEIDGYLDGRRDRADEVIRRTQHQAACMRPDSRGRAARAALERDLGDVHFTDPLAHELSGQHAPQPISVDEVARRRNDGRPVRGRFLSNCPVADSGVSLVETLSRSVEPIVLRCTAAGATLVEDAGATDDDLIRVGPDGLILSA